MVRRSRRVDLIAEDQVYCIVYGLRRDGYPRIRKARSSDLGLRKCGTFEEVQKILVDYLTDEIDGLREIRFRISEMKPGDAR